MDLQWRVPFEIAQLHPHLFDDGAGVESLQHGPCSSAPTLQEEETMKTISKAAAIALLAVAFGVPALAGERSLQDVARELKLKKDRKPGTFSAAASTVNGDSGMSWSQIEASNAAYLRSQREAKLPKFRAPRERPVQVPTYVPDPLLYGGPSQVRPPNHPAPPVVAPRAPAAAAAPVHRAPSGSSSGRVAGGGSIRRP